MRRVIHKLELDWKSGAQKETVPAGSRVVHVGEQQGKLMVWYETDLDQKDRSEFRFLLRYTGNEIPDGAAYLGTAMTEHGKHVVHVFLEGTENAQGGSQAPGRVAATRDSFQCQPMRLRRPIPLNLTFTRKQFHLISLGFIPQSMDDRWFVYWESPWLHIHRSWTGYETFQVRMEEENDHWKTVEAWANSERDEYGSTDPEHDARTTEWVIRHLLLDEQVEFP